ncbi:MAG: glutamate--cysteine ligase [bacterium]|nr:glutamate--cysteine ligase [bacterium]MBU1918759.1 glutamate--cysteine ligase [bacterium]
MLEYDIFHDRLKQSFEKCEYKCLSKIKRGIEKECLRVTPDGRIAQTDHPKVLGSALTHPYITTDYSEALLEFVTPAFHSPQEVVFFLTQLHQFVTHHIGDELLWSSSMPCSFGSEDEIRIAEFGSSNSGQMKHIYRRGLEYRYGKKMQCIAGIHYNFSFPEEFWNCLKKRSGFNGHLRDFKSHTYFGMIRNFERYAWLILYLFGASPAVCSSFFDVPPQNLKLLDPKTYYLPEATTFRMGDFGYKSKVQQELNISYSSLDEYTRELIKAIQTKHPLYEQIGVKIEGQYKQLSDSVLQIENEYYGHIRPKRIAQRGERPTLALKRRGVEYLEVRCLDLNPFVPTGIDEDQVRFMDIFITYTALEESTLVSKEHMLRLRENHQRVVTHGRQKGIELFRHGDPVLFDDWAEQIFKRLTLVAVLLDNVEKKELYQRALNKQYEKLKHPSLTPSGLIIEKLVKDKKSFTEYALDLTKENTAALKQKQFSPDFTQELAEQATKSLEEQKQIEASDTLSLDEYIKKYFDGFL